MLLIYNISAVAGYAFGSCPYASEMELVFAMPTLSAYIPETFLAWEREARLIMRVLPTYARSSHRPSQNLRIFQYA